MYKKITFLACLLFAFFSSRAAYNPVTLTGYNADIVLNGSATINNAMPFPSVTGGADVATNPGPFTFYAQDFAYSAGSLSGGPFTSGYMPASGTITSSLTYNVPYQLASYSANNALSLVGAVSGTLTFATPATGIGELYVMGVSGSSASTINFTVNFSDGTNQAFTGISFADWGSSSSNNALTVGRIAIATGTSSGLSQASSGFYFRETKLALSPSNYSKTIQSVTVANTTAGSVLSIMGITSSTVCSGAAVAGTAQLAGGGTSVCTNVSFGLTLSGNSVGVGISYQWQSNTGSGWTNISGATTNAYTVTSGIAVPTQFRAYVACQASSANADTSSVISIGLNPANQCYCIPPANTSDNNPCNSTDWINDFYTTGATTNIPSAAGCTSSNYINNTTATCTATVGSTVNFSIVNGSTTEGYKIWVDWNQNGSFLDPGELMYGGTSISANATVNGSFVVPATANPGATRIRIRCVYSNTSFDPCSAYGYGQTKDYVFVVNPLPACTTPTNQATALVLTPTPSTVSGSFTAASPVVDKYLVVRTLGTAALNTMPSNGYSYLQGATLGNGTVAYFGPATTFTDAGLAVSTQYRYTVFAVNNTATCGPTYLTTTPLTGTVTTSAAGVYTWNATTGSADWTVAASWTPTRTALDPTDILQFTGGGTSTATNIPTQTVGRLSFSNNTIVNFQAAAAATLTINSDNNPATYELNIASGSSLVSNGTTAALTIAFGGTGGTGKIAGTLEVANTTPVNVVNFANAIDTVTSTGTLAAGGTVSTNVFTSTAANLVINGTYNHKYTTVNGGNVPTATWGTGSTVLISGYTSATGGPAGGLGQAFYNFTYNCTNQSGNTQWSGTLPTNITGTLSVLSTGTPANIWQWATTTTYTMNVNNFVQSNGIVDLGTSTGAKTFNVAGNFNQTGGLMKASGAGVVTLNFNGITGVQTANFFDSSITGSIIYAVSNPAGINLTGTGYLATNNAFKINSGGGVTINSVAANPINTTLALTYATTSTTLTYTPPGNAAITANVWPTTNGPLNVTVNMSGAAPANRLMLPFSRTISASGTFTLSNGVVVLGANDLILSNPASGAISISSPGSGKMISADGTGQFKRAISTTASTTYLFPVGDTTNGANYSPVNLVFATNAAARNVGVRVKHAQHPNDLTTTNYLSRYWAFTDDGGAAAYTYNGTFSYPTTDVVGLESNIRLNMWNGTSWAQVPSTVSTGVLTIANTQSSTLFPLNANAFAGRAALPGNVYTWNGTTTNTDYQVASNWIPARNLPDPSDILQFNNGVVDTVKNIPTQIVGRLIFTNNTAAYFQAPATATLTLASDNDPTTNELSIASGSSLISNGTVAALTLAFSGTGGTGRIGGTLEVSNTSTPINKVDFSNAIDTVTSTGTIAAGGIGSTSVFTSTAANLVVLGTYNHKYTTGNGGNIPTATWGTGSNVLVSGYTTATGGPSGGVAQPFYNFTYNCPNLTVANQWSGTIPGTGTGSVAGTFTVVSTGTGASAGQWQLASTNSYTINTNNFSQTGGTVDFGTGASGTKILNVAGTFNQTGGLLKVSGTGVATVNYNGTAVQNVTFLDSSIAGPAVYQITNPAGINLVGTGYLVTNNAFKLNNNGGVRVSTLAAAPITTTLALTYNAGAILTYDAAGTVTPTSTEWPTTANGPANLTVNLSAAPANRLFLPASRTLSGTLTLTNGLIVLGSSDLTLSNSATSALSVSSPGITKMISADGSGQFKRAIPVGGGSSYVFPVGDTTNGLDYSPVSLGFASSVGARLIGIRVTDAQHPNDLSATNYLSRYWSFSDTGTTAYTYNGSFTYSTTTDVVGTESSIRLNLRNAGNWSQIPSSPSSGVLTIIGNLSSAFLPLGGNAVTGRVALPSNTYTWNGSISTDYQVPGNWTPSRNVPDPADLLQFNNGIVDTVKNVPTQTVTRLTFTNNTTAVFQAPSAATLTMASDNDSTTYELNIAQGSSLISNGTAAALTLAYSGTGGKGKIAGTLEISNLGSAANTINFSNAVDSVMSTGTFAVGGSTTAGITSTASNLIIAGTYNHKYTTIAGTIPTATWTTGSTTLISGYTTATSAPTGVGQTFYNFTYSCPLQTVATAWGSLPTAITNTLTVDTTGTSEWQWTGTSAYTINNFAQTKGTFNMGTSTTTAKTINVTGAFNQTKGILKVSGTSAVTLNYNGTAIQNVNFNDSAALGPVVYQVTNTAGINLTGSGYLVTNNAFKINSGGGVRISTLAANPINTTLALAYAASNTTLTYDAAGSFAATAPVWPATNRPASVTTNIGLGNVLSVPFSNTIPGTLTMTSGDIDMTSNTLTLGVDTTAAGVGTLTYTAGGIRVTTGSFVRWYRNSGLPTTAGNGIGFYPLVYGGINRNVAISFSAATALSSGGTIGVGHASATGLFTLSPSVADGTYNIDKRTNASWAFTTGNNIAASGTLNLSVTGTGLFNPTNPANIRLMQANAVAGAHVAGAGTTASRSGLAISDLAVPYYIGAANADIGGVYVAINTGNWSVGSTWDIGVAPTSANDAYINPGVTVTSDAATNAAKSLTILSGGTLVANNSKTVTIDSILINNGTVTAMPTGAIVVNGNSGPTGITNNTGGVVNVSGGTVTLGPVNGSNKPFINNGSLVVASGTLNVNGNFLSTGTSSINQTGGNINVDGNAGGNPANSVASGTVLVSIQTANLTMVGGTFTIVDPHVNATATRSFEYNTANGNVNLPNTHTIAFGNGVSSDTSANSSNGFRINQAVGTSKMSFGNMVVNSGNGVNRFVSIGNTVAINGNLTITSGEYRSANAYTTYLNGNLSVASGATFTGDQLLYFGTFTNGSTPTDATGPQTVSGAGTFRNAVSATPTANFTSITVRNGYGVTFNIGTAPNTVAFSGTATATAAANGPSRFIMASGGALSEIAGASFSGANATNGWVVSRYQKAAAAGNTISSNNFPVGDMNNYTPVSISTSSAVTTTGALVVGTTALDHPNIATSGLIASKSVNRYYTITPVNGIVIPAGSLSAAFTWTAADVDAGANPANFRIANYSAATWTSVTSNTATATTQTASGLVPVLPGDYQIAEYCGALNITTQPAPQIACVGTSATFSVALAGGTNGVTFQWQKGTTAISGATNATYTIPTAALTDAGSYSVIISSSCSAAAPVTSSAVTLTVNTPASISTQPAAQTICQGSPVTFTVAAAGTGITYQWMKNGTNITGATNATYTIPAVAFSDTANYSVTVFGTSPCGNVTSSNAKLTVNPLPLNIVAVGPTTFCAGGSVLLKASSISGLTYQWKLNGTNVSGATDSTYTASAFGNYTAQITNTANSCSNISNNTIAVTNGSPVSTITPSGTASVCTGDSLLLSGPNTAGLTYSWSLGGTPIPGATNQTFKTNVGGSYTLTVATTPTCTGTSAPTVISLIPLPTITVTPAGPTTFCAGGSVALNSASTGVTYQWQLNGANITTGGTAANYTASASGSYQVIVTSTTTSCKNTSAATTVTVNPLPTAPITAAGATTFCAGGSVVLKTNPATGLQYQWIKGGTNITGATDSTYTATTSGAYTVKVTNASTTCSATSTALNVTVNPLPNVTVTASNGTTICSGITTNLCVPSATGLTYQWTLNGTNITGATSACYGATLPGTYVVTVTNTATTCSATSAATTIIVNPAPTAVATVIGNTTVCDGDTVRMNANTGVGLTYAWYKNGTVIPGATGTAYAATTTGSYTVNVSNTNCTVTSNAIVVTVNPKPTAVITYTTPVTFCEGGAVVLTGVSGAGVTYQWQNNASAISGATDNYFLASQTGSYSVVVTNSFGCSTTTAATLVVVNPLPQPVISRNGTQLSTGSFVSYQWYLNSQPISGATSQGYTVTQNGAYYVRVTDANGCTNYSAVEFFTNVGVPTIVKAEDIKIFPNPVHEYVNIQAPVKVDVMIRDLQGRILMTQKDAKQIDLSRFADGVYMILILDQDGQLLKMEKLFKSE